MPMRIVDLRDQNPLLDIASYGRRGPGHRPLSKAEIEHISRTVRRVTGGDDQGVRRRAKLSEASRTTSTTSVVRARGRWRLMTDSGYRRRDSRGSF